MRSKMLANTYVYHDGDGFQVSTIDRESSAPMAGRFSETLVWDLARQSILHEDSCGTESLLTHTRLVEKIFLFGRFWESDDA